MQYLVTIKRGCKHGVGGRYQEGDTAVVGELELNAFGDKFTDVRPYVPDTPGFDLENATVSDILRALQDGDVTLDAVLAAERKRPRPRKTILDLENNGDTE